MEEDRNRKEGKGEAVSNDSLFELLSPAGDEDCLYAAVSAGADAVYAGGNRFGARAYAANFTEEKLLRSIRYLHLFGKRLYLTLNTLIKEREYAGLYDYVKPLYLAGLDGVIVQDLGVIRFLVREFPGLEVHASTQLSVASSYGAGLLKSMGVCRIVPARELQLSELKSIREKTGLTLECFIHGAMCCSYSGQCLMSSFRGGRSGNRGRCAGPCRQSFQAGEEKDAYLLSMKDLCALSLLEELMEAGIYSFKIEGRMKSPQYVYGVTSIYRTHMDRLIRKFRGEKEAGEQSVGKQLQKDRETLLSLYSRGGISEGYYHRHNGRDMVTMERGSYVREETKASDMEKKRLPVSGECRIISGQRSMLRVGSRQTSVEVSGVEVQEAVKRALTEEEIRKSVEKTGESDFVFEHLTIHTDGKSFLPVSALNALRRQALSQLGEELCREYQRSL